MKKRKIACFALFAGITVFAIYKVNLDKLDTGKYKYFNDVKWIERDGIYSLSIIPRSSLRWSFNEDEMLASWQEIEENFKHDDS